MVCLSDLVICRYYNQEWGGVYISTLEHRRKIKYMNIPSFDTNKQFFMLFALLSDFVFCSTIVWGLK